MLIRRLIWVGLVFLIFIMIGCAESQKTLRAYIVGDLNDWQMVEKGGYEGGSPKVDFLTGKDVTIRLECDNDSDTKQYIRVMTTFTEINSQLTYTPSIITVKLGTGEVLKTKVSKCSLGPENMEYVRSLPNPKNLNYHRIIPSLQGSVPVKTNSCYMLFIDHPIVAIDEEIIIYMNDALSANGKTVVVPPIVFKKNPKLQNKDQIKSHFR